MYAIQAKSKQDTMTIIVRTVRHREGGSEGVAGQREAKARQWPCGVRETAAELSLLRLIIIIITYSLTYLLTHLLTSFAPCIFA